MRHYNTFKEIISLRSWSELNEVSKWHCNWKQFRFESRNNIAWSVTPAHKFCEKQKSQIRSEKTSAEVIKVLWLINQGARQMRNRNQWRCLPILMGNILGCATFWWVSSWVMQPLMAVIFGCVTFWCMDVWGWKSVLGACTFGGSEERPGTTKYDEKIRIESVRSPKWHPHQNNSISSFSKQATTVVKSPFCLSGYLETHAIWTELQNA